MKKSLFLIFLSIFIFSCNIYSNNEIITEYLKRNEIIKNSAIVKLSDYNVIIKSNSIITDNSGKIIKTKKEYIAKIVDNEIKNNSVNIIFACEKDYGKYEGLIGKCDLNNIEFNSDIIYFFCSDLSENKYLLNYIKNNKAEKWNLSEIINCLSDINKKIKNYSPEIKKDLFELINYPKIMDYENIDYLKCKFPEWIINDNLIESCNPKIIKELINKKYGKEENTVLIYALKNGDENYVRNDVYELVNNFGADPEIEDISGRKAVDYAVVNDLFFLKETEIPQINKDDFEKYVYNWENYFEEWSDVYQTDNFFFEEYNSEVEDLYKKNQFEVYGAKLNCKNEEVLEELERIKKSKSTGHHPYTIYEFEENSYAYAADNTYLISKEGEKSEIEPGTIVRVLYTFPVQINDKTCSPFSKYLETPFVIVQNMKNGNVGLICSYYLAHKKSNVLRNGKTREYLLVTLFKSCEKEDKESAVIYGTTYHIFGNQYPGSKIVHDNVTQICGDDNGPIEIARCGFELIMTNSTRFYTQNNGCIDQSYIYYVKENSNDDEVFIKLAEFTVYTNDGEGIHSLIRHNPKDLSFAVDIEVQEKGKKPCREYLEFSNVFSLYKDVLSEDGNFESLK